MEALSTFDMASRGYLTLLETRQRGSENSH